MGLRSSSRSVFALSLRRRRRRHRLRLRASATTSPTSSTGSRTPSGPSVEAPASAWRKTRATRRPQLELANALQTGRPDRRGDRGARRATRGPKTERRRRAPAARGALPDAGERGRAQRPSRRRSRARVAFFAQRGLANPERARSEALAVGPITQLEQTDASEATSRRADARPQATYTKEADDLGAADRAPAGGARASSSSSAGRSQQASDFEQAIAAYERYLELAPNDANAEQVRELVKQLKQQQAAGPLGSR